jgi:hypothetical protein
MSSCTSETITLANSFTTDSTGKYSVINYTTITDSSSGKKNTSCLPTDGTPPVSRFPRTSIDSETGTVNSARLSAQVEKWLRENKAEAPNILTPTNNNPVQTFTDKSRKIREAIKEEYCYYQNRYSFMLKEFFRNVISNSTKSTADNQKDCVIYLNSVLNQILQVYQELINSRNTTIKSYYENSDMNVNSLNEDVTKSRESLQSQSTILKNANLATEAQSAMIDYSIEKNQSSRNLLAIYGFMNLVAASLIIYLYRSTNVQ